MKFWFEERKKIHTAVYATSNLKKINTSKNENTGNSSDESEKSDNDNSLNNLVQKNDKVNMDKTFEGVENNENKKIGNISTGNNRYLFKDVPIETDDKVINELASELEATNNKVANKLNEKNEKIQTVINKIEPMNINMNINKVENLNVNNNNNNNHNNRNDKEKKSKQIIEKNNNTFTNSTSDKGSVLRKMTNLEIYVKEKIIDLMAQIENLRQLFLNTNKLPSFTNSQLFNFPTYINPNTNNVNQPPNKIKEARIVEIGGKILPPPMKVAKKYTSNLNNAITAKDKESCKDINNGNNNLNIKVDLNMQKDRIKTGKNPTSIKSIINKTLGGNNNTIIFSNMANDINSKFLKGVEKKSIIDGGIANKTITENKINNINKFIELNKITTNLAIKTQNNFKNEINLLAGNNSNLP